MKTRLLSSLGALVVALLFPSCVALDDPYAYSGGNYSSGYSSSPGYYSSPGPVYGGRPPAYYGGGSPYYGNNNRYPYPSGRYPNGTVCPPSHYNHHDDHRYEDNRGRSSSRSTTGATNRDIEGQRKNSKGERLWEYSSRDKNAPQGNHTKDWYAERGHDLSKLKPTR